MTVYRCDECQYVGPDIEVETARGDPESGEAYWVTTLACSDCGSDLLVEVTPCIACLENGIYNEATHEDYCAEHAAENFECEAEQLHEFKRDNIAPVLPLVKEA